MAWPHTHDRVRAAAFVPGSPRTRYLVVRQGDVWLIKFDGEEFGPYLSEREAILFAIDAAHKLGQQGEGTQVLRLEENGELNPIWTHGIDAHPPNP